MSETEELERNLAEAWFNGGRGGIGYKTEQEARWSAEQQGLDFKNVLESYGQLYAKMEAASNGY